MSESQAGLLSATDAAKWLLVSPKTLFNLRQRGLLSATKIGKLTRFDLAELRRFADSCKETQTTVAV